MLEGSSPFYKRLFAVFFIAITAWRFVYLFWLCPFDLAQDEAHYWDWSRHLDWSYYSKGPLVAWLIRGSLELFGPMSVALSGSEMPAVRLPALFCGSATLLALWLLARRTLQSDRLAFFVALVTSTMPIFSAVAVMITIDSPFVCCWAWALVFGWRAIETDDRRWYLLTGLIIGIGILAKYTMLLWLVSLAGFLWFTPGFRGRLFSQRFWLMVGTAFACSLPILFWNASNGWVSFRHVAGQAGVTVEARAGSFGKGLLNFVGGQFALLLGWWFIFWLMAVVRYRPARDVGPARNYLWWLSWPTVAIFGIASLRSPGQVNWPVAAYLSGSILIVAWLAELLDSHPRFWRGWIRWNAGLACGVGIVATAVGLNSMMVREPLFALAKRVKPNDPLAVRALDPTCRMRGWQRLGKAVDGVRGQVRDHEGAEPVLAGIYWNIPGELGFYCDGHPAVYSLGPYIGERFNQYDLWRPNPVIDRERFAERTFVVVNGHREFLQGVFAEVELANDFVYSEKNVPVARWPIWVCRGYRVTTLPTAEVRDGY